MKICYKQLRGNKWYISLFTDASVNGLPDKISSAYGLLLFISNGYRPRDRHDCCLIAWKSSKIRRVVTASYDAEVLALSEGLDQAIVMRQLILDITGLPEDMVEIEAFCDNNSTITALEEIKGKHRQKRIGLEIAKVREMWDRGEVKDIRWIEKSYQIADALTKDSASRTPLISAMEEGRFFN